MNFEIPNVRKVVAGSFGSKQDADRDQSGLLGPESHFCIEMDANSSFMQQNNRIRKSHNANQIYFITQEYLLDIFRRAKTFSLFKISPDARILYRVYFKWRQRSIVSQLRWNNCDRRKLSLFRIPMFPISIRSVFTRGQNFNRLYFGRFNVTAFLPVLELFHSVLQFLNAFCNRFSLPKKFFIRFTKFKPFIFDSPF